MITMMSSFLQYKRTYINQLLAILTIQFNMIGPKTKVVKIEIVVKIVNGSQNRKS